MGVVVVNSRDRRTHETRTPVVVVRCQFRPRETATTFECFVVSFLLLLLHDFVMLYSILKFVRSRCL